MALVQIFSTSFSLLPSFSHSASSPLHFHHLSLLLLLAPISINKNRQTPRVQYESAAIQFDGKYQVAVGKRLHHVIVATPTAVPEGAPRLSIYPSFAKLLAACSFRVHNKKLTQNTVLSSSKSILPSTQSLIELSILFIELSSNKRKEAKNFGSQHDHHEPWLPLMP